MHTDNTMLRRSEPGTAEDETVVGARAFASAAWTAASIWSWTAAESIGAEGAGMPALVAVDVLVPGAIDDVIVVAVGVVETEVVCVDIVDLNTRWTPQRNWCAVQR